MIPNDTLKFAEKLRSIGLSGSYASELSKRQKVPSLMLALRIKRELGVDPEFWCPAPSTEAVQFSADERLSTGPLQIRGDFDAAFIGVDAGAESVGSVAIWQDGLLIGSAVIPSSSHNDAVQHTRIIPEFSGVDHGQG